ncbi:PREDICTED: mediator of RNA polymerase II transcription subunit 15a-like isoform X2 [Tarenaya hassleriana]|uniref:mediator of RNA polymerase II transcription subunit 15a-like isoform X2 n=1 Tax=Tarenaya hassleriana TaxID=28532 RepID=UPI00053CA7F9|nr:PREDICTED: mediator of RNA polymerase II transcription subunit 15a-like isoform X2 [Tarenaya hassleriana]
MGNTSCGCFALEFLLVGFAQFGFWSLGFFSPTWTLIGVCFPRKVFPGISFSLESNVERESSYTFQILGFYLTATRVEKLKQRLPSCTPKDEAYLRKVAVSFEAKTFNNATDQADYVHKSASRIIDVWNKTKYAQSGNPQQQQQQQHTRSSARPNQKRVPQQTSSVQSGQWMTGSEMQHNHLTGMHRQQHQQQQQQQQPANLCLKMPSNQHAANSFQCPNFQHPPILRQGMMVWPQQQQQQWFQGAGPVLQTQNVTDQQMQIYQSQGAPVYSSTPQDYTGKTRSDDWLEETYQKINALKEMYLPAVTAVRQRLQLIESRPRQQMHDPKIERVRTDKMMLDRIIAFLTVPRNGVSEMHMEKFSYYENKILNFVKNLRQQEPLWQQMLRQQQQQNVKNQLQEQLQWQNLRQQQQQQEPLWQQMLRQQQQQNVNNQLQGQLQWQNLRQQQQQQEPLRQQMLRQRRQQNVENQLHEQLQQQQQQEQLQQQNLRQQQEQKEPLCWQVLRQRQKQNVKYQLQDQLQQRLIQQHVMQTEQRIRQLQMPSPHQENSTSDLMMRQGMNIQSTPVMAQLTASPQLPHRSSPVVVPSPIAPNPGNAISITSCSSLRSSLESVHVGTDANVPAAIPPDPSGERPIEHLIKVFQSSSPKSLQESVREMSSVISLADRIAISAPGDGSRAVVGEDLVEMTTCHLPAKNVTASEGTNSKKKMKRSLRLPPLDIAPSIGNTRGPESEVESTASSCAKRRKIEPEPVLLREIREINQRMIDTVVDVCDVSRETSAEQPRGGGGTVVTCSYSAVALSSAFKAHYNSRQISQIQPLHLLIPEDYPDSSPLLLDKFPTETSKDCEDLSAETSSRFRLSLKSLSEPMSLTDIVRTWDTCVHAAMAEYAESRGGGNFSSKFGSWEKCLKGSS